MSTKQRQCQNNPDVICYICGEYMMTKYRFNVRDFTKRAYEAYFGIKLGDQDKSQAPHKVCKHCAETLHFWTQGKGSSMRFGVSMVGESLQQCAGANSAPLRFIFLLLRKITS